MMRDIDVRSAVRRHLSEAHAGDLNTRLVEEMGIWSSTVRIDLAVINGELAGYELKSNSDTLDRLPYQVEIYSKVFDRVTLVVGDRLADKAVKVIPSWWGCTIATMRGGEVALRQRRKARKNPRLDAIVVAQMLWKIEALELLAKRGLDKGWRSKPVNALCDRIAATVPLPVLCEYVRETLKRRERLGQPIGDQRHMPI
jgi:hypothetical protein